MQYYQGKTVCRGIVTGPIRVVIDRRLRITRHVVEDTDREIQRFEQAVKLSCQQLIQLKDKLSKEENKEGESLMDAHVLLLEDAILKDAVCNEIGSLSVNAEYAVFQCYENFAETLSRFDDEYMKNRALDIKDVCDRLLWNLMTDERSRAAKNAKEISLEEPSIVVADDLTPSQTLRMEKDKVLAFVLARGSVNSHTAILAKTMNVPALIGTGIVTEKIKNGDMAVVDASAEQGMIYISPGEELLQETLQKKREWHLEQRNLEWLKGKANVTKDGRQIGLLANAGSLEDVDAAVANDAAGVGLFRSEFLYLGRDEAPTEEMQFEAYRQAVERMKGKPVVIRTLDIGADKQVSYLKTGDEPNPAMGYRAIRICLNHPELFKPHLKAILRTAVYGDVRILYPMITSVREVEKIGEILREACNELEEQKITYRIPKQGVMIETPAAAIVSDKLAQIVDFFSIGTNDLTQYALAADRQNEKLEDFYDVYHEGVLQMIRMTVENAHKEGIPVGICGELAADPAMTEFFMKIGVDELSVVPSMILKLRQKIREL